MLKFMDSMNEELKYGKKMTVQQNQLVKPLIMQGARLSSKWKTLAKVNMPNSILEFGKPTKNEYNMCWKWTTIMMSKGPRKITRSL
jgi:hypothetical protein